MRRKPKNGKGTNKTGGNSKRSTANRDTRNFDRSGSDRGSTSNFDNASNDPNWYMHNPPLVRDTAMIPFSTPVGKSINLTLTADLRHEGGTYVSTNMGNAAVQPGVVAMTIIPAIGEASLKGSPVNIAAQKIYANIRRNKSGTLPYDASDVMMYILAMDQCYSFHEWMRRIYGYMNTFSNQNMYVPRAFAANDAVDFDDLMSHMTDFRFYINNFALRLSTYLVPQDFDLFKRHAFMYSNIYMDAPVLKAQYFQFTPSVFLKFNETDHDQGTCLEMVTINHNTNMSFADIKAMGENLLNAIIYSEDANTMSGDILRGYEASALWKPADTPENYSCVPVYNPEVLGQIHNATIVGDLKYQKPTQGVSSYIYQDIDAGIIKSALWRKAGLAKRGYLDSTNDMVTPAEVLVNTRLKTMIDLTSSTTIEGKVYYKLLHGTEVVTQAWITVLNSSGTIGRTVLPHEGQIIYTTDDTIKNLVTWSSRYTKFQNAPIILVNYTTKADASGVTGASDLIPAIYGDFNNVTPLENTALGDLHLVAITSLFGI